MKKKFLGGIVITICVLYFLMLVLVINNLVKPSIDTKFIETTIYPVQAFHPEPQESSLFLVTSFTIPFICGGFYILLKNIFSKSRRPFLRKLCRSFSFWSVIAVALLAFWGIGNSTFSYLGASSLIQAPILTLAFNCVTFVLVILLKPWAAKHTFIRKFFPGLIYFLIGLILIGLVFQETVFNDYDPYISRIHFIAYFDSIVQVYLGKTLSVDFSPQYGFYALMLAPIFKLIGLNVIKFTIVMGIIKATTYFSILLLIWLVTKNKLIGLAGFATIVFYTKMRVPVDIFKDPYFQYNPHRMIFPALFVLLLWLYIVSKQSPWKKYIYWLITILGPVSILWNPDTGLVVMATWLLCLVYQELLLINQVKLKLIILNCIKHFVFNLVSAICGLSIFYFYTYLSSGLWPDMTSSVDYIKVFNYYGFFLLPMPSIHPWNMVVLFYVIGLFISISHLIDFSSHQGTIHRNEKDPVTKLIFALSILGVGLFVYYVGRSHNYNLIWVSWPMLILATIFTDQLFTQLSPLVYSSTYGFMTKLFVAFRKDFKALSFIGLFYFLSASLLSIVMIMPVYLPVISERWSGVTKGRPHLINRYVDFIQSTSNITDKVFILSDYSPELYLYTDHPRPVNIPGFSEIIMKKDVDKISAFLSHPPKGAKIYWDTDYKTFTPFGCINLHPVESAPNNKMILFEEYNP